VTEAEVEAVMNEPLAVEALAEAEFIEQVDRALLEQARADAMCDVLAVAVLDDHGLDPRPVEEL
jgi:hypothetical protein